MRVYVCSVSTYVDEHMLCVRVGRLITQGSDNQVESSLSKSISVRVTIRIHTDRPLMSIIIVLSTPTSCQSNNTHYA